MLHATRRRDATSNTLQLRPSPQSYNNSELTAKQAQAKRLLATAIFSGPDPGRHYYLCIASIVR